MYLGTLIHIRLYAMSEGSFSLVLNCEDVYKSANIAPRIIDTDYMMVSGQLHVTTVLLSAERAALLIGYYAGRSGLC